jgi:hypothetical protein
MSAKAIEVPHLPASFTRSLGQKPDSFLHRKSVRRNSTKVGPSRIGSLRRPRLNRSLKLGANLVMILRQTPGMDSLFAYGATHHGACQKSTE